MPLFGSCRLKITTLSSHRADLLIHLELFLHRAASHFLLSEPVASKSFGLTRTARAPIMAVLWFPHLFGFRSHSLIKYRRVEIPSVHAKCIYMRTLTCGPFLPCVPFRAAVQLPCRSLTGPSCLHAPLLVFFTHATVNRTLVTFYPPALVFDMPISIVVTGDRMTATRRFPLPTRKFPLRAYVSSDRQHRSRQIFVRLCFSLCDITLFIFRSGPSGPTSGLQEVQKSHCSRLCASPYVPRQRITMYP